MKVRNLRSDEIQFGEAPISLSPIFAYVSESYDDAAPFVKLEHTSALSKKDNHQISSSFVEDLSNLRNRLVNWYNYFI